MKNRLEKSDGRKVRQLAQEWRRRIAAGELASGSRFPTWDELIAETGFSRATVGRALGQLQEDGFLVARGKCGTFVSDHPPCCTRIALVFPDTPELAVPGGICRVLLHCARQLMNERPVELVLYNLSRNDPLSPKLPELLAAAAAQLLAGVICVNHETDALLRPLLGKQLPIISFHGSQMPAWRSEIADEQAGRIVYDMEQFTQSACHWLNAQKVERAAVIAYSEAELRGWAEQLAASAIRTYPHWLLSTGTDVANAGKFIRLLFERPATSRPTGLLIADDTLVTIATRALAELGAKYAVPILAYANWPLPPPVAVPTTFLGYDIAAFLKLAIDLLITARQTGTPVPSQRLSPVFAPETNNETTFAPNFTLKLPKVTNDNDHLS